MRKWTILFSALLIASAQIYAQHDASRIDWKPVGEYGSFKPIEFRAIGVDDQAVFYTKVAAGMKVRESSAIKASHSFAPIKTLNLMPEGKQSKTSAAGTTIVAARNGKILAIDAVAGMANRAITTTLAYKVLGDDFSEITVAMPLKQPGGGYVPVNSIDLSNPYSNNPFQIVESESGILLGYVLSEGPETNLTIGLAKFDNDLNLVYNHLHETEMPAHRMLDFRLADAAIEGSDYVIIKETTKKNPSSKIEMPMPNTMLDDSQLHTNEETWGINRIYRFNESGSASNYVIAGELPTPAFRVFSDGTIVVAGLMSDGAKGRFTGAYSITLDRELQEVSKASQPFSEMYSNGLETFKTKEKGIFLTSRHLKILDLGGKLLLHIELFGSRTIETNDGGRRTYTYNLLVGDNLLFQMERNGAFTGLFEKISKDQLEYGASQNYAGSVVMVKNDVLRIYFNDHPDNLIKERQVGWNQMDYKKGNSLIREIQMDANLKKVSDSAVSAGKKPVLMLVNKAFFSNGYMVMFGTDFDNYVGAVMK